MTFRVACLGAGYFAQFHHDGWGRIPQTELVGIADRDISKATATGMPAFDDLATMLQATKPDIVDIIVPPAGHADAIRTALEFNPQLIICQKPFCNSLDEAKEIAALARAKSIPLIIHENFRFQPWFQKIDQTIKNGEIGVPVQATFRLRPGDGQGPNAYLDRQPYFQQMPQLLIHETGVHYIDTFRALFGNPLAVYADLRKVNPVIQGEDAGIVIFEHTDGMRVMFDGNRTLDHAATNTRCTMGEGLFEGMNGTLTLTGDGAVHLRKFGDMKTTTILPPDDSGKFGGDCTYLLQKDAIDALMGRCDFVNAADEYLTVIEIETAIYNSARDMRKVNLRDDVK